MTALCGLIALGKYVSLLMLLFNLGSTSSPKDHNLPTARIGSPSVLRLHSLGDSLRKHLSTARNHIATLHAQHGEHEPYLGSKHGPGRR